MLTLKDYKHCGTEGLYLLDAQLIAQIQLLAPGVLIRFDYLPVRIGPGCHPYLQAPAVKALEKGIREKPGAFLECNSAYRTLAQQFVLYDHYLKKRCGISLAARPGRSNHESAKAIDIDDAHSWRMYLAKFGWDWLGSKDPMHFDFRGAGCRDIGKLAVLAYQKLWNLNHPTERLGEDGIMGDKTLAALARGPVEGFEIGPKSSGKQLSNNAIATPNYTPLRRGSSGADVQRLQKALATAGHKLAIDGTFGKQTEAAVKQYQADAGLVGDGVVGVATSQALKLTAT